MKYKKPWFIDLANGNAAPYCATGTGANTPGCTVGMVYYPQCETGSSRDIAYSCALGNVVPDGSCLDGNSPGGMPCHLGSSGGGYSRCYSGNTPIDV